ncbi:MAG TPA: UDP-glucose 4-epimerase GalE [Candidatus Saccharimonadales bacterium]|nr:UDP-glucose 4-epimerase GalE [Candidatus Saccharimonadales bacterium]
MTERILVTGGAGYVGSACCTRLLAQGHSVDVVDDLSTGHVEAVPSQARLHSIDIGNRRAVGAVLNSGKIDVVFHFAAKALISESVSDPGIFFQSNLVSGIALLETLRAHNVRKFVFSSSAAVYGTPEVLPITEDHPKEPVNAYGESKLAFERILRWYARSYGWSVVAFRYFNACGGGRDWGERHDPETHIIPLLLQTASGRRSSFEIYGTDYQTADGTCLRDYVHVMDIAEAHILALRKLGVPGFHVYNIGTGRSHSVLEVSRVAEAIVGAKINIRISSRRPGDPDALCASPARLMTELGWQPVRSELSEIVRGAWEWEKAQRRPRIQHPASDSRGVSL